MSNYYNKVNPVARSTEPKFKVKRTEKYKGRMKVEGPRPKKCTGKKIPRACAKLRRNNKNYI